MVWDAITHGGLMGRKDDRRLLIEAAELFAKLSGLYPPDQVETSVDECGQPIKAQVVSLRDTYERYLDESTCTMRELVIMAGRGDIILRFGIHVRLHELLTEGRLGRIYKREKRSIAK